MTLFRQQLDRWDGLLAALAVAGLLAYFLLLPTQHPDAAADYELGEEGAAAAAEAFLRENGYARDNLEVDVVFHRHTDLLDSLQHELGRPQTVAALRGEAGRRLPAYYWEASWNRTRAGREDDDRSTYRVALTPDGRVWDFERETNARPDVNRAALAAVLGRSTAAERRAALPDSLSDALLAGAFVYTAADSLWVPSAAQAEGFDGVGILRELAGRRGAGSPLAMGPAWAVALARHHLERSALADFSLRVDSAWVIRTDGRPMARVRFSAEEPYLGQAVRADVDVAPTGVLLGLDTAFNTPVEAVWVEQEPSDADAEVGFSLSVKGAAATIVFVTYFLLVLVFLFLFFRRLNARLIDAKTALRDAFWGGFFLSAFILLLAGPSIVTSTPGLALGLFIAGVSALIGGAGGAFAIFFISGVADSVARDVWPQKLEAITLVRHGFFRNVPVGLALLRGSALALVLLGLTALALALLPEAALNFTDQKQEFLFEESPSPAGYLFGFYGIGSLFVTQLVLLGAGTLFYRRRRQAAMVVGGLVLLMLCIQVGPFSFQVPGYTWVFSGIVGTVLAIAFWRYDVLACFTAYLYLGLLWEVAPGWLIAGVPMELDAMLLFGMLGATLVLGFVGLFSGRAGSELPSYVPQYMQELAQEERLKRELEIAHQVQESFLPRRMPKMEGLDIAAMCLAAQEVGGDYYDFIELGPGRLGVVVGDVSGKGIQAAFYMTLTKGFLLTLCRSEHSPAEVLRRLNALFCENAPRGMFISMIYGVLDVEARTFTFARAGHNPVILKRSPSQESDLIQPTGMAIGLVSGARFDDTIEEATVHLRPGDVLVFYTDGFSEAMNAAKEQYSEGRLARKVSGVGQRSAGEILRAVSEDVHHFVEATGRQDDMTMVVLKLDPRTTHVRTATSQRPAAEAQRESAAEAEP